RGCLSCAGRDCPWGAQAVGRQRNHRYQSARKVRVPRPHWELVLVIAAEALQELSEICGEVTEMSEGGRTYLYLPKLKLPSGCPLAVVEGLLCIQEHSGYATRLFLSCAIAGRGANWTAHHILGRTWHTWSWNNVSASLRPTAILAEHLRALR